MGINQFDPEPDPHFRFLCEHGASGCFTTIDCVMAVTRAPDKVHIFYLYNAHSTLNSIFEHLLEYYYFHRADLTKCQILDMGKK